MVRKCLKCGRKIGFIERKELFNKDTELWEFYCPECYETAKYHLEGDSYTNSGLILVGIILLVLCFIFFFIHFICFLVFLLLACVLILAGLLRANKKVDKEIIDELKNAYKSEKDPINLLKLRYAKGEIDKEEYEQMKKDIEG